MTARARPEASRTAAALTARRRETQSAIGRVHDAITQLRRAKSPASVAAVARRAGVSRTILYANQDAKSTVVKAIRATTDKRRQLLADSDDSGDAAWREGVINGEDGLKAAHAEMLVQCNRIGKLLGQIRDLEAEWTQDAVQRITTENTTLKERLRQLTTDNRLLDERLTAVRSNLRFQDRRIADLETHLADPATAT